MDLTNLRLEIAICMKAASAAEIEDLEPMKAGMTNDSYVFKYKNKRYIYRIPGKGSSELVNRQREYEAYKAIRWLNISDVIIYYDKKTGIKISEFIENAHTCNPYNMRETTACLLFVKNNLHKLNKFINSRIDLPDMILKYQSLMGKSKYADHEDITTKVLQKVRYYRKGRHDYCLCHFDLNPDNFLLTKSGHIHLLDWEYAGMHDPWYDVAGWIVYKKYDKDMVDNIFEAYLERGATAAEFKKFYACIAAMGLLWSNWCEYKRKCGEEFGDYAEQQFNYAKKYIELAE